VSHYILIGKFKVFLPHDDEGRSAEEAGSIEFGDIVYTPAHGATEADQGKQVQKILKALGKLGEHGE